MACDPKRARDIVKMAAKGSKIPMVKSWLKDDSRGVFERMACRLIEIGDPRGQARGMTTPQVNEAVANEIALAATEAVLRRKQKR